MPEIAEPDWSSRESVQRAVDQAGSVAGLSRALGIARSTLQARMRRVGAKSRLVQGQQHEAAEHTRAVRPGIVKTGSTATITGEVTRIPTDTLSEEKLMRAHDLDPEEWEPDRMIVNRWDSMLRGSDGEPQVVTLAQAKLTVKRRIKLAAFVPARCDGWKPPKRKSRPKPPTSASQLVAITTDAHDPYIEQPLHEAYLKWLRDLQPDRMIDLGDGMDLPQPSRHPQTPGLDATAQECIDASYRTHRDRREAAPDAEYDALLGNHDDRLRLAARDRLSEITGLTRARVEEEVEREELPLLDVGFLLRFDELDINLIRPGGEYYDAEIDLTDALTVEHGSGSGGRGATAKRADRKTISLMRGHVHRAEMTWHTRWAADRTPIDTVAVSVPMMARRDLSLAYIKDGDQQQGFATVTIHETGEYHVELGRWTGEALLWRGERWTP